MMTLVPVTGWRDSAGTVHDNKRVAEKAEARLEIRAILSDIVDFRDEAIDIDQFITRRDELIAALEMLKD